MERVIVLARTYRAIEQIYASQPDLPSYSSLETTEAMSLELTSLEVTPSSLERPLSFFPKRRSPLPSFPSNPRNDFISGRNQAT